MFEDLGLNRQEFNVPDGFFEFTLSTLKDIKGLEPYQIVEYKALCGDTSDNIPGVKGVGEKAVIPLLQEYGNIESIYDTIENLSSKEEKTLSVPQLAKDNAVTYIATHPTNDKELSIATLQNDVYRSTDVGATWDQLATRGKLTKE